MLRRRVHIGQQGLDVAIRCGPGTHNACTTPADERVMIPSLIRKPLVPTRGQIREYGVDFCRVRQADTGICCRPKAKRPAIRLACAAYRSHVESVRMPCQGAVRKRIFDAN